MMLSTGTYTNKHGVYMFLQYYTEAGIGRRGGSDSEVLTQVAALIWMNSNYDLNEF